MRTTCTLSRCHCSLLLLLKLLLQLLLPGC
jgi:hypothetical protein